MAASPSLAVINPASFAFAPEGNPATTPVSLDVRVPHGWVASGAMPQAGTTASAEGDTVRYAPTTLYTMRTRDHSRAARAQPAHCAPAHKSQTVSSLTPHRLSLTFTDMPEAKGKEELKAKAAEMNK